MSPYRGISLASFFGCAPALDFNRNHSSFWYHVLGNQVTPRVLFDFICNPIDHTNGYANYAPYGLRKVEAALLRDGYRHEDVVVAHPDHVEKFIGSETEVVGTYEMDPLGMGPVTMTFTYGRKHMSYDEFYNRDLHHRINAAKARTGSKAKVIAAHCVHVDIGEIRTLKNHGAGVSHNPSSNLKLASGFAPVTKMLEAGLNVGIGTDGPASNNDLDMFEEVRLASFIAKAASNDPTAVPAQTALTMATRLGAQALHLGHLTGSITPGRRADLIVVDTSPLHNSPRFRRDPNNAYAQIVYASKSTDVSDVMVNGKWLMRDRKLLTLNEDELIYQARDLAGKMDAFLIEREQSVLSKLIALGGSMEEESYEVQVKVKLEDPAKVRQGLERPEIEIVRARHYDQHDTYFFFDDPAQGRLRYREDEFLDERGNVTTTRPRLTLVGQKREGAFAHEVLLSRSRFLAPATQTLRFYREYFKPAREAELHKDRLRWLIKYKGIEFFVNLDDMAMPPLGHFLEVKSRTWSRSDAQRKSELVNELLALLGAAGQSTVTEDYIELVTMG